MARGLIILLLGFVSVVTTVGQTPLPSPRVFAPKPRYLDAWARKGITGKGVALLKVDKNGYVVDARMLKSTGHKILDDSALEAFRKWHFMPGKFAPEVRVPIEFKTTLPGNPKT